MKYRTASSNQLGPAPAPFDIPSLPVGGGGGGGSLAASSASKANATMMRMAASPPPSSKKKNDHTKKRSKVRSPLIRSPLGFHKLHNSGHGGGEDGASVSEASASLSSSGGGGGGGGSTSARRLMFSPRKRGGVGARAGRSKSKSGSSSSNNNSSKSPIKSRDIYSPTPEKKKAAAATTTSGGGGGGFRGSISHVKVKGSLRKERKRRKSSFAGMTSSASRSTSGGNAKASMPAVQPAASASHEDGVLHHQHHHHRDDADADADADADLHQPELKPAAVEFAYPTSDAVAVPGPSVLQHFHQLAISARPTSSAAGTATVAAETHQAQLDSLGTHLLSLEDVLLPSAAQQETAAIKFHQARLQRDPAANAPSIDICRSVRAYLLEMASLGATAARANRLGRESAFRSRVAQRDAAAGAERRRRRAEVRQRQSERRAARAARRRQDKAARRVQDIKSHPRNKELYREMAALLKDQNRLQREERKWEEAGHKLAAQEAEVTRRLESLAAAEEEEEEANGGSMEATATTTTAREVEQSRHLADVVERSAHDAIDDILTSAGRLEGTLTEVAALVEESDATRRELYGKYRTDHQFHGYRGNKNTKGLIVALSQG